QTTQGSGQGRGQEAEGVQEEATLHAGLPRGAGAEAVAVDEVDLLAKCLNPEGLRREADAEDAPVERAEPAVVIAGQEGQATAAVAEGGEGAEAVAGGQGAAELAAGEPEVAEVADDRQGVVGPESGDEAGEPAGAIGAV